MKQLKDIKRWPFLLMIIGTSLLQACSIIEDNDIQRREELTSRLRLNTILLNQNLNSVDEPTSIGVGAATYNGDQLTKIQWSGVAYHSNYEIISRFENKLRFNYFFDKDDPEAPQLNSAKVTMNISYNSAGYPSRITHIDDRNGFEFESFEFTYDASGRVTDVITNRSNLTETSLWKTTDEVIYSTDGSIESMSRITENVISTSTSSQQYFLARHSSGYISQIIKQPNQENFVYEQFCPNEGCFIYGPDFDFGGTNTRGNPQALFNISNNVPSSIELVDSRTGADPSGNPVSFEPNRNPDIFYFHPIIMFPHLFQDGVQLSQLYLDDWWQSFNLDQMSGMTDEKISINYNYSVD